MRPYKLFAALAVAAVAVSAAACSPDSMVTAPGPVAEPSAPLASKASDAFDVDGDGKLNETEKAAAAAAKAEFEQMEKEWKAYKDAVKKKLVDVDAVRCAPLPRAEARHTFGPKGGTLKIGPHELKIPAGALSDEVEITASTEMGARREVEFEPHGLQFNVPVKLTMSYDRCIVPDDADLEIVYTGRGNQIIARQPSKDDKDTKKVEGLTDHFSGYLVAYGRSR